MGKTFISPIEQKVLALLGDNPGLYGLELVKLSKGKLKRGTVYVVLGRLEERGLVHSAVLKKPDHPGLPRPVYGVTGDGYRMLEAWKLVHNQ